jgi:hypothetical protein
VWEGAQAPGVLWCSLVQSARPAGRRGQQHSSTDTRSHDESHTQPLLWAWHWKVTGDMKKPRTGQGAAFVVQHTTLLWAGRRRWRPCVGRHPQHKPSARAHTTAAATSTRTLKGRGTRTRDGLGVKGDVHVERLGDAVQQEAGHPHVVAALHAQAGADLRVGVRACVCVRACVRACLMRV